MTPADPMDALRERGYDIQYLSHARSILLGEFSESLAQLANVLTEMSLPVSEIVGSGGGETKFTQRTRKALSALGWKKHNFVITKTIDGIQRESTSHEVDHIKSVPDVGTIGCEIEWNNKDPFFDRDLENFKRLHAEGAISVGIIITRGLSLQSNLGEIVRNFAIHRGIKDFKTLESAGINPTPKHRTAIETRAKRTRDPISFGEAWASIFVASKFGAATTHWEKLQARVARGVGNPCPLLLIGLPASIVVQDQALVEQMEDDVTEP